MRRSLASLGTVLVNGVGHRMDVRNRSEPLSSHALTQVSLKLSRVEVGIGWREKVEARKLLRYTLVLCGACREWMKWYTIALMPRPSPVEARTHAQLNTSITSNQDFCGTVFNRDRMIHPTGAEVPRNRIIRIMRCRRVPKK
jgi:hypothetical protein